MLINFPHFLPTSFDTIRLLCVIRHADEIQMSYGISRENLIKVLKNDDDNNKIRKSEFNTTIFFGLHCITNYVHIN